MEEVSRPTEQIELSEAQMAAQTEIMDWFDRTKQNEYSQFVLGGYAGTGKTHVIKALLKKIEGDVRVIAYTGKAVSVLKRKGVFRASTVHQLIYYLDAEETKRLREPVFVKVPYLPEDVRIIVDEASMISRRNYQDLISFNRPVLYVGDHGQLQPIGEHVSLMENPDFRLETIFRQAKDSEIIKLSCEIRWGLFKPDRWRKAQDIKILEASKVLPYSGGIRSIALEVDQIICAYNTTRQRFNYEIRKAKGFSGSVSIGERLVCLRNNSTYQVYNGQILFVEDKIFENDEVVVIKAVDELGVAVGDLPLWKAQFNSPKTLDEVGKEMVQCDYGYAITCHKAQADSFKSVLVFDELGRKRNSWDPIRWRYTAVTRAESKLYYCC